MTMSATTLSDIVSRRPTIRSILIPEVKKRKEPNKYYVYKILVEWSNGNKTVVYRRYSAFFDFNIKLLELYSNLCERNPSFEAHIPELPGKILFGRSQIHQVAEKRRGKIEEYSQQLLTLPVELSSSGLVLGFFNTWQDDAAFPLDQPPSGGDRPPSPLSAATFNLPSVAPTGTLAAGSIFSAGSNTASILLPAFPVPGTPTADNLVGHADDMENLEQYKVIADYERKDSHQVTLYAGQVVHVIEKHDTGWWMVMAEDEQGYAPAAHLEPMEEGSPYDHLTTADDASGREERGVYEALENYIPQSEDEVGFKAGDKVEVIAKSMDGWWKIKVNNKVGLSPSTLIHKGSVPPPAKTDTMDPLYETGGMLYEGLHVHRPPPRRNTVTKRGDIDIYGSIPEDIYALPRTDNVWIKTAGVDDADDDPNGAQYYKVPRSVPASAEELARMNGPRKDGDGPKVGCTSGGVTSVAEVDEEEVEGKVEGKLAAGKGPISTMSDPVGHNREHAEGRGATVAGEARAHLPAVVSAPSKGKVEADEYVFMADQEEGGAKNGGGVATPQSVGVNATLPVTSSPLVSSRHPASSHPPTSRARSLSEDRLLSNTTRQLPAQPPQAPPSRPAPAPPQVPDEYVDMSNDVDDTYAVPPDAMLLDEPDGAPSLPPGPPTGARVSQEPSAALGAHKGTQVQPQAQTQALPGSSSPRPPPASQHGITPQRSSGSSGSSGSSPPGARKDQTQTPPIKAPKPLSRIKVGDAVVEVESKADLHKELREMFGQKSKSASELDVPAPREDTTEAKGSSKPAAKKKILFGGKGVEGSGVGGTPPSHKPLEHTISSPVTSMSEVGGAPRVFVAHCDYTSQTEGCLSFSKGDRCVLVKNTPGGWWMVSINGKEGWTPSDYWDEEMKVRPAGRPLPVIPTQPNDKKPKDAKSAAVPGTTTEPPSLVPAALPPPTGGSGLGAVPPPADNDRQLSDSTELKKAPSMSGPKGKPSAPPPFKKNTPEKPTPPSRLVKPGATPQGAPVAPLARNGEVSTPPSSRNGELGVMVPPGGVAVPPADKNGKPLAGKIRDEVEGREEAENFPDSEYSLLSEAVGDGVDFRNAPWFVGKMEREKAEQVLKEYGRQRDFLVRERVGKDGFFAISIRHHYSFKHFNIDPTNEGKYSMGPLTFGSLEEIVTFYQSNSLFIHDGQHVTLGQPVKLKNRSEKPFVN